MSIFTELLHRKITFAEAKAKAEQWAAQVSHQLSPEAQAAVGVALTDLKQAASNAVDLADSLAAPLLATGADAVGLAFDTAAKTYLGPFAGVVSPAAHDAIDRVRDALKAEIDARAMELKAALGAPPAVEQH